MKVALVYDRVNKWGGAERVLLALHELFPEAPLFTSVYNPETASWARKFSIKTSFLQQIHAARLTHEYFALAMPYVFEQFSFDAYDLVISVSSEAAKGILTKPETKHLCYCLTPTRYLWSGYDEYFTNYLVRFLAKPAVSYLRAWDKMASSRPDRFIAVSETVRSRIETYYERKSAVIYPPLTFSPTNKVTAKTDTSKSYFLVVSRLVPYKRVDLAIQACSSLQLPLKIIGTGSDEKKLRQLAGPTISFIGSISDSELRQYYENCRAFIFPGEEDFGLTVVEAQSSGKPVIAYRGGGALETIREGKTGVFFERKTAASLEKTLREFDPKQFDPAICRKQAERFSLATFKRDFLAAVEQMV